VYVSPLKIQNLIKHTPKFMPQYTVL